MRIDNTQINKVFELHTLKVRNAQTASGAQVPGSDRFTMSCKVSDMASVGSTIASMPNVRQDKVDQYRNAVQSGSYEISDQDLAEAIVRNAIG